MKKKVAVFFEAAVVATMVFASGICVAAYEDTTKEASAGLAVAIQGYLQADEVVNKEGTIEDTTRMASAGLAVSLEKYYQTSGTKKYVVSKTTIDKQLKMAAKSSDEQKSSSEGENEVIASYENLAIANVKSYLNIRKEADIESEIIGLIPKNGACEILEEPNEGWTKIKSGKIKGYVDDSYLLKGNRAKKRAAKALLRTATVHADQLMVREETNTDCTILCCVAEGEELEVIEILDGWVKVNINEVVGYVCADYVTVHEDLPIAISYKALIRREEKAAEEAQEEAENYVSDQIYDVVSYAEQFLGNPYVYGGTSLTNGTDCSGFTMGVYGHFGYSLPHSSAAQSGCGTRVSLDEIQPGDLLFYSYGGSIGHVAIYIGNGQIIHASTETTGIIISNAYSTTPTCATRIMN